MPRLHSGKHKDVDAGISRAVDWWLFHAHGGRPRRASAINLMTRLTNYVHALHTLTVPWASPVYTSPESTSYAKHVGRVERIVGPLRRRIAQKVLSHAQFGATYEHDIWLCSDGCRNVPATGTHETTTLSATTWLTLPGVSWNLPPSHETPNSSTDVRREKRARDGIDADRSHEVGHEEDLGGVEEGKATDGHVPGRGNHDALARIHLGETIHLRS